MPPKRKAAAKAGVPKSGSSAKQGGGACEDAAVVWFRKCLRLHDNAALLEAAKSGVKHLCPVFVVDPHFGPAHVGVVRYRFLLESLADLDAQLKKNYGSRLLVLRGKPEAVMGELLRSGRPLFGAPPRLLLWERDYEPYALKRDKAVEKLAADHGVEVRTFTGHTLYDPEEALRKNKGKSPTTNQGMVTLAKALGEPPAPLPLPAKIPPLPKGLGAFPIPTLKEMGYKEAGPGKDAKPSFPGGERAGLARMAARLKDAAWIRSFEKPKTRSTAFDPPSTTILSPYLKFGCVSVRRFYQGLRLAIGGQKHSQPPVSLKGQLYFREMAVMQGLSIPNFDKQVGNPACKQIPWGKNPKFLKAWEDGKTGYPFIDACMRQLRKTGWLHHLARHAVACFLTRGDLWISWEEGRDVFDKLLVDQDWAINNQNWLALAGVSSWSPPYFRVYHPVPKMDSALTVQDPEGKYVREFVPELRDMPAKYIYAPWTAPFEVQRKAKCIVGKDYPKPIVEHEKASSENMTKFRRALSAAPKTSAAPPVALSGGSKRAAPAVDGSNGKRARKG